MDERERFDRLTDETIGSEVHRSLGPGLLESAYETCLAYELSERGIDVERQKSLPVTYREVKLDAGYRLDLLVGGLIIVEVKAIDRLLPIHDAQLLSYLRLSGCSLGLLINLNVRPLEDGIKRLVNNHLNLPRPLHSPR